MLQCHSNLISAVCFNPRKLEDNFFFIALLLFFQHHLPAYTIFHEDEYIMLSFMAYIFILLGKYCENFLFFLSPKLKETIHVISSRLHLKHAKNRTQHLYFNVTLPTLCIIIFRLQIGVLGLWEKFEIKQECWRQIGWPYNLSISIFLGIYIAMKSE